MDRVGGEETAPADMLGRAEAIEAVPIDEVHDGRACAGIRFCAGKLSLKILILR